MNGRFWPILAKLVKIRSADYFNTNDHTVTRHGYCSMDLIGD